MPSIIATAVIGSAVVGGVTASSASSKAASVQSQAADQSAQVQREGLKQQQEQFDTTRKDALDIYSANYNNLGAYRDTGTNALLALSDQLGIPRPRGHENTNTGNPQFKEDPGYKFAFDEGMKAVDARFPGMSKSGAKAKALTQFGQGVADQQYGNWLSRLGSLASVGQTATGQAASLGTGLTSTLASIGNSNANAIGNYSANAGNLLESAAAARASGYVGSGNAINDSIGSGINNALSLFSMRGPNGTSGGYSPFGSGYAPFYSSAAAAGF